MKLNLQKVVNLTYWSNKYNRPGEGRTEHALACGCKILTKNRNPTRMACKNPNHLPKVEK